MQNSGIHVHIHRHAVVWPSVNVPGCLCQYQTGEGREVRGVRGWGVGFLPHKLI